MSARPIRLTIALCVTLAVSGGGRAASQTYSTTPTTASDAQIKAAAETLIPAYAAATSPPDLTRLYRLQLACGRYADAETTMERLQALYLPSEHGRANALVPWRIYARAKRYETSTPSSATALQRAFAELYGSLPDRRMADVLVWYGADLDRLRAADAEAAKACDGAALNACAKAADLIAARQALAAWSYLLPASAPLIRADAERRFVIDDRLLIPTPDGAKIAALLVRPRAGAAKRVSLLNFTIYARDDWSFADAVKIDRKSVV